MLAADTGEAEASGRPPPSAVAASPPAAAVSASTIAALSPPVRVVSLQVAPVALTSPTGKPAAARSSSSSSLSAASTRAHTSAADSADATVPAAQSAHVQLTADDEDDDDEGAEDDALTGSSGSSDEENEAQAAADAGAAANTSSAPCGTLLPRPLLYCLSVLGCTFLLASLMLSLGVKSWGVREARVAKFNEAVALWNTPGVGFASHMARASFALLDLRKHVNGAPVGAISAYANDTWLLPVTVQSYSISNVASTAGYGEDPESDAKAAKAAAAAASAAAASRNVNGLNDMGTDVHPYAPLYYEILLPSPLLAPDPSDASSAGIEDDANRFWANLLTHDSRTLSFVSFLDGTSNSRFNVTIPFLKRESSSHSTRRACEGSMSGVFDRAAKTCSYFSQLHSICLRVKLTDVADATEATRYRWSFDADPIPSDFSSGTTLPRIRVDELLTSLTVLPPTTHAAAAATPANATDAHAPAESGGCIWDDRTGWAVGEYHAVDIRSERDLAQAAAAAAAAAAAGSDGADPMEGDDAEDIALRKQLELSSLLRITLKSSRDPFLLAQEETQGLLWFGQSSSEEVLLAVVIGSVGGLFLLAPIISFCQYMSLRTSSLRKSKRARRGGYESVGVLGMMAMGVGAGDSTPVSPSDAQATLEEEGGQRITLGMTRAASVPRPISSSSALAPLTTNDGSISTPEPSPDRLSSAASSPHTPGFVPSEELRRSLVSSPTQGANGSPSAHRATASFAPHGEQGASTPVAITRSKRLRIDPVGRYFEPRHLPAAPSRTPTRKAIKPSPPLNALGQTVGGARSIVPTGASVSGATRPRAAKSLSKVLSGRFSFSGLLSALGDALTGGSSTGDDDGTEMEEIEVVDSSAERAAQEAAATANATTDVDPEAASAASPSVASESRVQEISRALSFAALQEQRLGGGGSVDGAMSPLSPFPPMAAPDHMPENSTLTPWTSPNSTARPA